MSAEESKRVERTPEEIAAQREVKKSEDAIRKIEPKLNKLADGSAEKAEVQAQIDTYRARIAELCAKFGLETKADKKAAHKGATAAPSAAAPVSQAVAPVVAAPTPAPTQESDAAEAKESKRVERTPEEIAAQREVKKCEDNLRKIEPKLNKLADGSAEKAEVQTEVDRLKARIAELCAQFGLESKADKKAAHKGATAAAPTAAAAVPALSIATIATAPGARVDPARLKEELEACKAKLAAATDPAQMTELRMRLATLIDACITMATEQTNLATVRASPAMAPQAMTPFQTNNALASLDIGGPSSAPSTATTAPKGANNDSEVSGKVVGSAKIKSQDSQLAFGGESTSSDRLSEAIHPRFYDLAIRSKMLQVVGGNARTFAFIDAILAFIRTTDTLSEETVKELSDREKSTFLRQLNLNVEVLAKARPLCQGMKYVMSILKDRIDFGVFVEQHKTFVRDQVAKVVTEIADGIAQSIKIVAHRTQEVAPEDTILVYGRSSCVEALLLNVARSRSSDDNGAFSTSPSAVGFGSGGSFGAAAPSAAPSSSTGSVRHRLKVIVLDAAPLFEGRGLAKRLQAAGIAVRYALASAASQLMPLCTKVFLGASAVMQSGDVVSRCGTAMVAACAKTCQKPVFVFAEDHKFTREVWIGSFTRNEFYTACYPELAGQTSFQQRIFGHDAKPNGCMYDVTPSALVDVVVTRLGRAHPSAVCGLIMPDDEDLTAAAVRANNGADDEDAGSEEEEEEEEGVSAYTSPDLLRA